MSCIHKQEIKEYYGLLGVDAIQTDNVLQALMALGKRRTGIIISDNRVLRGVGKLYHMPRTSQSEAASKAECHFAFIDALKVLAKKGVPVFFYNRIGLKKDGFPYKESALERMKNELSFPKMAEKPDQYDGQLREVLGEKYSLQYLDDLQKIPQIVKKGNIYSHEDGKSNLVNVVNGKRVTSYTPDNSVKRIHIYGRCGAFGYAVSDDETLASQIQRLLNPYNIEVVNHGLWGGEDKYILHNFFNELAGFNENDIVLFYMKHFDKKLNQIYEELGMHYLEITEDWHKFDEAKWCFYDKPGHMNATGYKNAAKLIVEDLIKKSFMPKATKTENESNLDAKYLNGYLKEHKDDSFEQEVAEYVSSIINDVPTMSEDKVIGSIVMNCNPFTKGHRFLIEYAASKVDRLFIFVVEEDRSFFKFKDRFEMVKAGTADLGNVVVVPSGNFIISTLTFPEYFLKDYVKEKNFDVSQDLETFCSLIAKPLHIQVRFAGEEPFDPVTKNYNENMKKILPSYGMEFVEIPRLKLEGSSEQINATKVRELLKEKNVEELKKYVPETTLNVLLERYF